MKNKQTKTTTGISSENQCTRKRYATVYKGSHWECSQCHRSICCCLTLQIPIARHVCVRVCVCGLCIHSYLLIPSFVLKLRTKWGSTLRQNIHKHDVKSPELPKSPTVEGRSSRTKWRTNRRFHTESLFTIQLDFIILVFSCIMEAMFWFVFFFFLAKPRYVRAKSRVYLNVHLWW